MCGLHGTTLGVLVVDEDRRPGVELLVHLEDFRGQRDVLGAIVSPFAGHERFDDPAQSVRTQQAVGNDHGSATSALRHEGRGIGVGGAGFAAQYTPVSVFTTGRGTGNGIESDARPASGRVVLAWALHDVHTDMPHRFRLIA